MGRKGRSSEPHSAGGGSALLVIVGDGKGKTTAALGQALRVWGNGGRVAFFQFIKSPRWETGEARAIRSLQSPRWRLVVGGRGFVGILGDTLPREIHQQAAQRTFACASRALRSGRWDLVVLDELLVALSLSLLPWGEVRTALLSRHHRTDVVVTGRASPQVWNRIVPLGDIVTECREVHHHFQSGTSGRRGREY